MTCICYRTSRKSVNPRSAGKDKAVMDPKVREVSQIQATASSFASATRAVTGIAVNNMFSVLRASFAQNTNDEPITKPAATVDEPSVTLNEDAPLKRSTASRGRGISREKRN